MRILRSITRRGFSVGTAGWFTVLTPNTWFAASRLQDHAHHVTDAKLGVAESGTPNPAIPSLIVKLNANDPGWIQFALTALAATAITSAVLLWIIQPK